LLIVAPLPNLPQQLRSAVVLARFSLRMLILLVFAAFGNVGFGSGLAGLLWMAGIFSAIVGIFRREPTFDKVLNHWDEMMAYAALCCLVGGLNQTSPF
jgi:hypothetical protein